MGDENQHVILTPVNLRTNKNNMNNVYELAKFESEEKSKINLGLTGIFGFNMFTINDFEFGKPLGRGKFGHVYLAREKRNKYIVAIKVLSKRQIQVQLNCSIYRKVESSTNLGEK